MFFLPASFCFFNQPHTSLCFSCPSSFAVGSPPKHCDCFPKRHTQYRLPSLAIQKPRFILCKTLTTLRNDPIYAVPFYLFASPALPTTLQSVLYIKYSLLLSFKTPSMDISFPSSSHCTNICQKISRCRFCKDMTRNCHLRETGLNGQNRDAYYAKGIPFDLISLCTTCSTIRSRLGHWLQICAQSVAAGHVGLLSTCNTESPN